MHSGALLRLPFFHFPDEALELTNKFRQTGHDGGDAEPLPVVESGGAAEHTARWNIAMQTSLGGGNDTISDTAMAGDTDLSCKDDVSAYLCGPGKAGLRA